MFLMKMIIEEIVFLSEMSFLRQQQEIVNTSNVYILFGIGFNVQQR